MNLELSNIVTENIGSILRVIIDLIIIWFSLVKLFKYKASLRNTYITTTEPLTGYENHLLNNEKLHKIYSNDNFLSLISFKQCTISYFRLRLLLTSDGIDINPWAYIELEGEGDFDKILLYLPFLVNRDTGKDNYIEYSEMEDMRGIIFKDERLTYQKSGIFKIKINVKVNISFIVSSSTLSISLPLSSGPFTSGQPFTESHSITIPIKEVEKKADLHFPLIKKMEISISGLPDKYFFEPFSQMPAPEYYSDNECRWITGISSEMRRHSSVFSRIQHRKEDEQIQIKRIEEGIAIGIWTSVFVTVIIDFLWSLVGLFNIL